MSIQSPNTQNAPALGGAAPSGDNPPLTGDKALLAVMLMQIYELKCLAQSAGSESDLSVALRTTMQNSMTERLEEFQKLLSFASYCEGDGGFAQAMNWLKNNAKNPTWASLVAAFPNLKLSLVPKQFQNDFVSYFVHQIAGNCNGKLSEFRNRVGTLGTQLQEYGTYQEQCKNLADGFQNGAGSLTQSITQYLAQLSSESSLLGDVVAQ